MKFFFSALIALLAIGGGYYYLFVMDKEGSTPPQVEEDPLIGNAQPLTEPEEEEVIEITTEEPKEEVSKSTIIGYSVKGHPITAYHYGTGETELLLIGGIHGGYEWNTILLSYQFMDYFDANPAVIPDNIKVTIVPSLNPDGVEAVIGTTGRFTRADVTTSNTIPGRFNGNTVDINRNFDCDWQSTGVWQDKTVDAGSSVLSEPEAQAIKNYIDSQGPEAVVVYFSSAGGVYASNCHSGVLPETNTILNVYAKASGYPAYDEFDFYATTGDVTNWLAKVSIPAFSVLLTTHEDTEWSKNKAGVDALINYYAGQ